MFSGRGIFCSGRYQPGCTGSSDQRKISTSLSLFLKSEKIPALLYVGKGHKYRPFVFFDLFPQPTGLWHRSQITEAGPSPIRNLLVPYHRFYFLVLKQMEESNAPRKEKGEQPRPGGCWNSQKAMKTGEMG
jgi:hypothetical protein